MVYEIFPIYIAICSFSSPTNPKQLGCLFIVQICPKERMSFTDRILLWGWDWKLKDPIRLDV